MKHASISVVVGAILIAAPLLISGYQTHEIAVTMQKFAATGYNGTFNVAPGDLISRMVPCVVGVLLVIYGSLIGYRR